MPQLFHGEVFVVKAAGLGVVVCLRIPDLVQELRLRINASRLKYDSFEGTMDPHNRNDEVTPQVSVDVRTSQGVSTEVNLMESWNTGSQVDPNPSSVKQDKILSSLPYRCTYLTRHESKTLAKILSLQFLHSRRHIELVLNILLHTLRIVQDKRCVLAPSTIDLAPPCGKR